MNIAFFSEAGFDGKVPRTMENMRTEYAWYCSLEATHHNIFNAHNLDDDMYDVGVGRAAGMLTRVWSQTQSWSCD